MNPDYDDIFNARSFTPAFMASLTPPVAPGAAPPPPPPPRPTFDLSPD